MVRLRRTRSDRSPRAVVADRHLGALHDHRYGPVTLGVLQHLLHSRRVLRDVHVPDGHFAFAVLLTGGSRVGSGVFPENPHRVGHRSPPLERGQFVHSSMRSLGRSGNPSLNLFLIPNRPLDSASHIHHHPRLPSACRRPQVQLMVGRSFDVAQDDVMRAIHRLALKLGREAGLCQ